MFFYIREGNMQNRIKILKITSKIHIIAYLCMYAVSFVAYESSRVNMMEGNHYQSLKIYVLTMLGLSFTLSMLRYRQVKMGKFQSGELILVYDILQMTAMIVAASKSFEMLNEARVAADRISSLFGTLTVVISAMIAVILFITIVVDIALGIFKQDGNIVMEHSDVTHKKNIKSYVHTIVLVTLVVTYVFSSVYAYGIVGVLFFMWLFLIAFPLPCGLFFNIIVKEWIVKKKYIWAIGVYGLYMYLTYGVFYNLFSENVYGYSAGRNAMHIFGVEGVIGYINVIAGGIVVVLLVAKALQRDNE